MCPNAQVGCKATNQALLRATVEGLPHLTHLGLIARTNTVYHNHDDCIVPRCTEVSAGWAHPGHTCVALQKALDLGRHGRRRMAASAAPNRNAGAWGRCLLL